ncbi:MAG TPA: ATP-binding protein [Pyrinomonadaceae bacterium]|jgi:signal transduction histidine kinase
MSLLEVLQFVGYSTGAALHLWMGGLLLRRRSGLGKIERVLLALAIGMGVWHASNLLVALHGLLGLERERWSTLLRLADTFAVVSITLSYSFLLHVHIHLWANARGRALTLTEKARIYLSYIPALFLFLAVPHIWRGAYEPMLDKFSHTFLPFPEGLTYSLAFALWAAYVLALIAVTDLLIARLAKAEGERRSMQMLAASLVAIACLLIAVYAFGVGEGTRLGHYLKTLANLGSLLPSALIAYYIYRYRYLELMITESLIVASFAAVVLAVYLYGIRTIGAWLTEHYQLRAGAVEALLILALVLVAAPLRRWLERRFHRLFEREASLYRDIVARIGAHAGQYRELPELLRYVEERTAAALNLKRVQLIVSERRRDETEATENWTTTDPAGSSRSVETTALAESVLKLAAEGDWRPVENKSILRERGFEIAYPLRRENETVGLMLVDGAPEHLTTDARSVLEVLAGQVAIAVEDCRLVEENVRLERQLAHGERLAALGQMAATVAHEVKNPLSAIKSIAQVMREDKGLTHEYARDLNLIVGETDRLSRSVTQLLSFARTAPPAVAPSRADELIQTTVELFKAEAAGREIALECRTEANEELDGVRSSALRDALSNLLSNALFATPPAGRITVEARIEGGQVVVTVVDSGSGIAPGIRQRIWEPFFTTKQRGTGLGLSILKKRMEEVGGLALLAEQREDEGARFELRVPVTRS